MATCKDCVHNNICNIKQRYNHPKYALQLDKRDEYRIISNELEKERENNAGRNDT